MKSVLVRWRAIWRVTRFGGMTALLLTVGGGRAAAQWLRLAETTQETAPAAGALAAKAQETDMVVGGPGARAAADGKVVVPTGMHLPLVLRNGVNTRTAKAGDAVYFQTMYPIALGNRVVIPMGSFVRGVMLSAKRPGRIMGRGEFRIALEQMTFANGYTIDLRATPSSLDRDGREGVDAEGKIKGAGSVGKDVGLVAVATGGGAFIGTLTGAAINGAAGRGALIGGGAAGIGTLIALLATRGPEAELPRGTVMDVTLDRPLVLSSAELPEGSAGTDPQRFLPPPSDDARRRLDEERKQRLAQSPLRLLFPFVP